MRETTPALYIYADGRESCRDTPDGRMLYLMRRYLAWIDQGKLCAICFHPLIFSRAVTDHVIPRGMAASRRDDRLPHIQATCFRCNGDKGSQRY